MTGPFRVAEAGPTSDFGLQQLLQGMPMAIHLILGAVAHDGDPTSFGQRLKQPKRELLAVVPDGFVLAVNVTRIKQLLPIPGLQSYNLRPW
jgi:hypothetical protein